MHDSLVNATYLLVKSRRRNPKECLTNTMKLLTFKETSFALHKITQEGAKTILSIPRIMETRSPIPMHITIDKRSLMILSRTIGTRPQVGSGAIFSGFDIFYVFFQ